MKPFTGVWILLILYFTIQTNGQDPCAISTSQPNTNLQCIKFSSNKFCFVSCKSGFKFSRPATDSYVCNYSTGTWYEGTGSNQATWPDCVPE
ncbi:sushi, von Willebrand factor type A, EGF and pentraxin domain-containing protein 1-like [Actinia tenebrosa]|uniref:Sushi, von Willebrand factor type A, EGF and pentraxin domain-containing protein 1-like n=1 Tax=Actinia tenebrosa TaxID=6105 RepID=A0A6P8I4P1_ACTTE|nr:sushi, von Willebrand factor type A, EGF and pentraxin domain-containing protein 1-like [Actinia tenebrosa]